jgi:hypothetical protein
MSARFDPGAQNVEKALKIYEKMKRHNGGALAIIVDKSGKELRIRHNRGVPGNVVGQATTYVAECARRFGLTGLWSAVWIESFTSGGEVEYQSGAASIDLGTQAIACIDSKMMRSAAEKSARNLADQKRDFPFEVALPSQLGIPQDWLRENAGDGWRFFPRARTIERQAPIAERVFLFKETTHATAFKLRFG